MRTSLMQSLRLASFVALATVLGLVQLQAQTTANWIGPATGGEWNTAANWDTGAPPLDSTTNAFIGFGTNVNYNIPMSAASFGTLTLNGILNINAAGFTNGSISLVRPGGGNQLFVNTGGVVGVTNGGVTVSSNAYVTVSAGGTLVMSG